MAIDRNAPFSHTSTAVARHPELMLAAALHLMSHYTAHAAGGGCVKLASVIERHLRALSALPELAPVLRATCQQLSEQWAAVVDQARPPQERAGIFTRLMKKSGSGLAS